LNDFVMFYQKTNFLHCSKLGLTAAGSPHDLLLGGDYE